MKIQTLVIFLSFCLAVDAFFDIQLEKLEIVEQDLAYIDASNLKVRKMNKTTRAVIGKVIYSKPLGNDIMMEAKIFKKQGLYILMDFLDDFSILLGGEYRLTPYKLLPTPFCKAIQSDSESEILKLRISSLILYF